MVDYADAGRKFGKWLRRKTLNGIEGLSFILTIIAGLTFGAAGIAMLLALFIGIIAAPFVAIGWGIGAGFGAFCWLAPVC